MLEKRYGCVCVRERERERESIPRVRERFRIVFRVKV